MQSASKQTFQFNKGINTEAPLTQWPEGYSIDEQNFDLLIDGSRRRRPGIALEAGNVPLTAPGHSTDASSAMKPYRWSDAGLISGNNLVVVQVGSYVHFWVEPTSGALGTPQWAINLGDHAARYTDPYTGDAYSANSAMIREAICDFTQVNGKLIIVNANVEVLLVTYVAGSLEIEELKLKERDLFGVDDGVSVLTQPTSLSNSHEYNLSNRGWLPGNVTNFFSSVGLYPSKNMLQYIGNRSQTATGVAPEQGTKLFTPAALNKELFTNMSAPQGHNIREVFNRRNSFSSVLSTVTTTHTIKSTAVTQGGVDQWRVDITVDTAHGVVLSDIIALSGLKIKFGKPGGNSTTQSYSGNYTVVNVLSATSFRILIDYTTTDRTYIYTKETGQYTNTASAVGAIYNQDSSAIPIKTRFTTTATFASRAWFAGCSDDRISNRVYFSTLVEDDGDIEACYQEADPTSEFISDLVATDGGYVVLPEAGSILQIMPFASSLIVFSTNSVWEIGPGTQLGVFSATGYSVRKLSNIGCVSARSILNAGNTPVYWGEDGIYVISQDETTGYPTAKNTTLDTINGLFTSIRHQEKTRVKGVFDPLRQRAMWLYNSRLATPIVAQAPLTGENMVQTTPVTPIGILDDTDTTQLTYDSILLFDMRLKAWTRWTLGASSTHWIRDIVAMPTSFLSDSELRLKILAQIKNTNTFNICEFSDTTIYRDLSAATEAFVFSGPDSVNDPDKLKNAPYVHVFMRRNENSSVKMQARWDWARGTDSSKIAQWYEVYRETRPRSETFGMVVTKNKVSGRGRNLFLAFKSYGDQPCWIDGWTTKFDANMRI